MPYRFAIVGAMLAALLPAPAGAAPHDGELAVRMGQGGQPCFTVSAREQERSGTPDFISITVSDGQSRAALWHMALPPGRSFVLTASMCIPYAGRLPVLPQTPAAPLQPGRVYEVSVAVAPSPGAPRNYHGRFCLARASDGALDVNSVTALARGRYGCAGA